jgi:hypothetical protein
MERDMREARRSGSILPTLPSDVGASLAKVVLEGRAAVLELDRWVETQPSGLETANARRLIGVLKSALPLMEQWVIR